MTLNSIIKNDPLVKMLTGKSVTTKKRKPKFSASMKRKVNSQIARAKKSAYKKGLSAGKRKRY